MATVTRVPLSGGSNGKNILISATTSGGANTVHTAGAATGGTTFDEIYLWAYNSSTGTLTLTILYGGTTSPNDEVKFDVPPTSGPYLIIPGWYLENSLVVKAYAGTTNLVSVNGYANRIVN